MCVCLHCMPTCAGLCSGLVHGTLRPEPVTSYVHLNFSCNIILTRKQTVVSTFERAIHTFSRPIDPEIEMGAQQVCVCVCVFEAPRKACRVFVLMTGQGPIRACTGFCMSVCSPCMYVCLACVSCVFVCVCCRTGGRVPHGKVHRQFLDLSGSHTDRLHTDGDQPFVSTHTHTHIHTHARTHTYK